MESGNLFSIISRLISFNRIEKEADHLASLETKISSIIKEEIRQIEDQRPHYGISTTRQLALEQIRFLN